MSLKSNYPEIENNSPTTLPEKDSRTDMGNAARLVSAYGKTFRWFPAKKSWLRWDGMKWVEDDGTYPMACAKATIQRQQRYAEVFLTGEERKDVCKYIAHCSSHRSLSSAVALAKSERNMQVSIDVLDTASTMLNTQSGVLDLDTGELTSHDDYRLLNADVTNRDIVTKVTSTEYIPGATSALWEQTLENVFGDDHELRDYVQRALGYSLLGNKTEKAFWFCYGPTNGGKSTFLEVISNVLGDYAISASSSTWMRRNTNGGNRGDLVRLSSRRLVISSEVKQTAKWDEEILKAVTGCDSITAADKFEKEVTFTTTFSLWLAGNDRPKVPDGDDAFWGRVRCIPFERSIPAEKQDRNIKIKLLSPEHAPAILQWLIDGYRAYRQQGLGSCAAVDRAGQEYRTENNGAYEFYSDCLEPCVNGRVSPREMHEAYIHWCKINSVMYPLKASVLTRRLRELGLQGNDDATRINKQRYWLGVKINRYACTPIHQRSIDWSSNQLLDSPEHDYN